MKRMCDFFTTILVAGILYSGCLTPDPAEAQWQVPDHAVPIGRGAGVTGFKSAAPGVAGTVLTSNGASSDPTFQTANAMGWYIVGSTQYPTAQAAATAANTAGGGVVYFPCLPPLNSTYSIGAAAIGLDMRNFRNVRLVGGGSVNAGGSVCTYLNYTGTGVAIDVSGSAGTEISGILLSGTSSASLVRASNQGALAAYLKVDRSNFQGNVAASNKCFDLSYIIIADISASSINCYKDIAGKTIAGDVSNVINIGPGNTFQPGSSIHLENAGWWNVFNNTLEGGLLGIAYRDTLAAGNCNSLNMTGNKFDDPALAAILINTNCIQYNSKNNLYSVAAGSAAVINYQASSGMLTSHGDWFDTATLGIAFNTGNYAEISGETLSAGSLYSGVPASAKVAHRTLGNEEVTGAVSVGTSGTLNGTINLLGATSSLATLRAQSVAGGGTFLMPSSAAGGTLVASASAPCSVNATTGNLTCNNVALVAGTAHGDSNYTILSTDRYVYTSATFTAARTWTLPAASSLAAGTTIWVQDAFATLTTTNTLSIARGGSDLINSSSASFVLTNAGGGIALVTDGVSNWGTPVQTVSTGGSGRQTLTSNALLAGNGTNPVQMLTVGTNGQLLLGATGAAPAFGTMSQDCTITAAGVITCTKTNNVAFATSATTDTTNAANITSGTLPNARIVGLTTNTNMIFGTQVVTGGSTAFFLATGTWSSTEAVFQIGVPSASTIRNMYTRLSAAPVGAQTMVFMVRKNGADTSVTCTVTGAATACSDTSNSVSFAAGDLLSMRVVASATAVTANNVSVMLSMQTTSP